jgi:hypothetical protein
VKKLVALFTSVAILFLIIAAVLIATGHASTTKARPNSLGVLETYQNPNQYLLALPVDGQILEGQYTNIRFQPFATAALYDETLLFCGNVAYMFDGKRGPVVVTYRKQASRLYKGVACHDLIAVFEVPTK